MSDAWHIGDRISAMIEALEQCPMVEVIAAERAPGITQAEIDAVHAELGWQLDPAFLAFFRANDGLTVRWVDARGAFDGSPTERFAQTATEDRAVAGAIAVRSLRTTVFDHGDWDYEYTHHVGQYTTDVLGGWDDALLRDRLHPVDDFLDDQDFGSYYEPTIVVDPIYPHPPVLIAEDNRAALSVFTPIPAADYLDFVVATFGTWWARRARLYRYAHRGVAFYVPPDGWLDAFPPASQVLDTMLGHELPAVAARVDALCTAPGQPVSETPFASYVDPSQTPRAKAVPRDTPAFDAVRKHELGSPEYWDGLRPVFDALSGTLELQVPRLDVGHYRADRRITPSVFTLRTLVALIGTAVLYEVEGDVRLGCLLSVKPSGFWVYRGSLWRDAAGAVHWGSYSYDRVSFDRLSWLGRAVPSIGSD